MKRLIWGIACCGAWLLAPALPAQEAAPPSAPRALFGAFVEQRPASGDRPGGVVVMEVTADAPAAKAGIERGDVIARVGDRDIRNVRDFFQALAEHKPGDKVKVAVLRGGKTTDVSVTLGERTGREAGRERGPAFLGIETEGLTPAARQRLGVNVDTGVVVLEVLANSPAAKAGLQRGDVITGVNEKNVTGPEDVRAAIRAAGAGQAVNLKIVRGKDSKEVKATLEAGPTGVPMPELPGPLGTLERRINELEKRVQELEAKAKNK